MGICYRLFWTLPIGICFVKFGLKTALHISYDILWSLFYGQLLATPGPFEYFCQNMGPSENQSFLDEGAISGQRGLGF